MVIAIKLSVKFAKKEKSTGIELGICGMTIEFCWNCPGI